MARSGLAFDGGKLSAALWAKNLTNRYVETFAYFNSTPSGVTAVQVVPNAPRTFGIELSYKLQ